MKDFRISLHRLRVVDYSEIVKSLGLYYVWTKNSRIQ